MDKSLIHRPFKTIGKISRAEVLAIIDQESDSELFFDSHKNKQYLHNMKPIRKVINDPWQIHIAMKHFDNRDDGKILKFRFSEAQWNNVHRDPSTKIWSLADRLMLSVSAGLGQKLMYYYYKEQTKKLNSQSKALLECEDFISNIDKQLTQVSIDLQNWLHLASNDRVLAYSMYNAGKVDKPNSYGKEVQEKVRMYERM